MKKRIIIDLNTDMVFKGFCPDGSLLFTQNQSDALDLNAIDRTLTSETHITAMIASWYGVRWGKTAFTIVEI